MTHDQYRASDPGASVWVSASAGTGKTKVLTDRVLRLLLNGTLPSKILCITYTKAAAAEMEHRIDAELGKWSIIDEKDLEQELSTLTGTALDDKTLKRARQLFSVVLDAPQRIRIQTIHGFCQSILRRFPLEAGVAPHFTVIDERSASELMKEAKIRLFTNSVSAECTRAIQALALMMSDSGFNDLIINIIKERAKFSRSIETNPQDMKARIYAQNGMAEHETEQSIFLKYFTYTKDEIAALHAAAAALQKGGAASDLKTYAALQHWLDLAPDPGKIEVYLEAMLTDKGEIRDRICTQNSEKHMPDIKSLLRTEQARVLAYTNHRKSLQTAEATYYMTTLARSMLGIYRELKETHGYLDYEDIIQYAVRLLSTANNVSWVLYKLDNGIDHLLVDEAQDTSPEQWRIVDILTSEFFAGEGSKKQERSLFIVGDSKQSIFSFQGARPEAFHSMQEHLRKRITSADIEFRNIHLSLSFRSTEPVLHAVDSVFSFASIQAGLNTEEQYLQHISYRKGMAGRVEFWPLIEASEPEHLPAWHTAEKQFYSEKAETILARDISREIKEWLDKKRKIASQDRPIEPGDIMILVQKRGSFTRAMLRALKKYNIPVAGSDRLILTEHIAIKDCIALANFLLLPQDSLTLAVLLKSPFIGLSEDTLFELAYERGNTSLWHRLRENPRCKAAYDYLSDLLAHVDYMQPYELFSYVLEKCEGRKKLAARLGNEIHDPLDEFMSLAMEYSTLHAPSLQGFLHWLQSDDTEIKRDMENNKNKIRIITVHGAKGLQAPIVFLPDTTRIPPNENTILWSKKDTLYPEAFWAPSANSQSVQYFSVKEELKQSQEQEYNRLLYVAMTRAEDELYICGFKSNKQISEKCWYETVKRGIEIAQDKGNWREQDGKLILQSEQSVAPKTKKAVRQTVPSGKLPKWIHKSPLKEAPRAKPLSPSHMETPAGSTTMVYDQNARLRGFLMHRLLQYLPDVVPEKRQQMMDNFITRYGNELPEIMQSRIYQEINTILDNPDFSHLFSSRSIAEAPISGIVQDSKGNDIVISGQIDRLVVLDHEVYIIDYKTNALVPETEDKIPSAYIKQMAAYRTLIKEIYPDKAIHCGLLWTAAPKLMLLT